MKKQKSLHKTFSNKSAVAVESRKSRWRIENHQKSLSRSIAKECGGSSNARISVRAVMSNLGDSVGRCHGEVVRMPTINHSVYESYLVQYQLLERLSRCIQLVVGVLSSHCCMLWCSQPERSPGWTLTWWKRRGMGRRLPFHRFDLFNVYEWMKQSELV